MKSTGNEPYSFKMFGAVTFLPYCYDLSGLKHVVANIVKHKHRLCAIVSFGEKIVSLKR